MARKVAAVMKLRDEDEPAGYTATLCKSMVDLNRPCAVFFSQCPAGAQEALAPPPRRRWMRGPTTNAEGSVKTRGLLNADDSHLYALEHLLIRRGLAGGIGGALTFATHDKLRRLYFRRQRKMSNKSIIRPNLLLKQKLYLLKKL